MGVRIRRMMDRKGQKGENGQKCLGTAAWSIPAAIGDKNW